MTHATFNTLARGGAKDKQRLSALTGEVH